MQPEPKSNEHPECWPSLYNRLLMDVDLVPLMKARHELGKSRYGTALQPFNGRDALQDALEEALDMLVYLEQHRMENPEESEWVINSQVNITLVARSLHAKIKQRGA